MAFEYIVQKSIVNVLTSALKGQYSVYVDNLRDSNLFGTGVSVNIGENSLSSFTPQQRNIVSLSPDASVIIKKKAFSAFKGLNDLQWMDKTEKMLLRTTKALFAHKVAQIRAYESLTKFEDFFKSNQQISLNLFVELLQNAKYLDAASRTQNEQNLGLIVSALSGILVDSNLPYDSYKEDILKIAKRNAFSQDLNLTTWIVDPESTENYSTGPGTGVIEITTFTNFTTSVNNKTQPSAATLNIEDPYKITNIAEEEIELAIQEALYGTVGLLDALISGEDTLPLLDTSSVISAGLELIGLGDFDGSLDIGYIRDRMRTMYLGKSIINPGDGIHYFIRGNKTVEDYNDLDSAFDESRLKIDESILEAERILFTNKSIDLETYKKLRRLSDNSLAMRQVFSGFVKSSSRSFSGGKWTLKAECTDNMGWLQWSRYMSEPAISDPQGYLEDPLTPYEIKKDGSGRILTASGIELLEENKALLKSGLLRYDSGLLNGQVATEYNLLQGQYSQGGSLRGARIMQHPSGFVYRWKKGIISASANLTGTDPYLEGDVAFNVYKQAYGFPAASTDGGSEGVLNNLDIANILSILIVGQPYNVESFVEQAYMAGSINNRSTSLDPNDAISGVIDVVRRQNKHLGNFKPYRMISLSSMTLEESVSGYILRNDTNNSINQLRQRKVKLKSLSRRLKNTGASGGSTGVLNRTLQGELTSIDNGIQSQVEAFKNAGPISGAEVLTGNYNLLGQSRTLPLTGNYSADYEVTRAMTVLGAQRRIEDVRLNRDNNLFIVSDQYDENTDIRPFLLKFRTSGYKVFQGMYVSTYEKCDAAANFMNMEFFCNNQGHLEFRPPQWNKTPLSILERLFQIKKDGVVPEFLKELFDTRTTSLRRDIHTINVKIVLLSLLLGKYPDSTLIPGMIGYSGAGSLLFFGINQTNVEGVNETTTSLELSEAREGGSSVGSIQDTGNQVLGDGLSVRYSLDKDGDILSGNTSTQLGIFDPVFQESNFSLTSEASSLTNKEKRQEWKEFRKTGDSPIIASVFDNILSTVANPDAASARKIAHPDALNAIRNSFKRVAGTDPASEIIGSSEFSDKNFVYSEENEEGAVGKINNYLSKLQSAISERDKLVSLLERNEEKQQEIEELESILSGDFNSEDIEATGIDALDDINEVLSTVENVGRTAIDIFSGDATEGSLFDHLVEFDDRNLLGPGSGKRFIIEDHDILSCTFSEQEPDATRVDVVGNAPFVGDALNNAFDERYYWAGASDFDLWRQFGYKYKKVPLPFSSDAELQSRPYAIMELQIQRTQVNQAQMTLVGNEYYSPGDVVFVRDNGMLYYVTDVTQSFDFPGQSFSTTLKLENGHPPGVYLPSPLDIIGQQLTKNPLDSQTIVNRNSKGDDKYRELKPDSSILFPANTDITMDNISVLLDYKDNAVRLRNMMISLSSLMITGTRMVLIRCFITTEDDAKREIAEANMDIVKNLLMNPLQLTQADSTAFGANVGNTKGTQAMLLPNGMQAYPVSAESIVLQTVILQDRKNEEAGRFEIKCINKELGELLNNPDLDGIMPLGGPKQKTWLDLRDDLNNMYHIIEVGILDLSKSFSDSLSSKNSVKISDTIKIAQTESQTKEGAAEIVNSAL